MNNSETVRQFMETWAQRDVAQIMDFFSEDASYCNIPMGPPLEGKAEIREFIEGFIGAAQHLDFKISHQLSNGDLVMNERVDILQFGGEAISLPVMGVFRLEDGKIREWRDYFDMAAFAAAG